MEQPTVFTAAYLEQLITNATKNDLHATCPDGCNIKQFLKIAQDIATKTCAKIEYIYNDNPYQVKITP